MKRDYGILGYNNQNDRFGILSFDLWVKDGLHCGDLVEVFINDKWIKTNIEMDIDGEWYLVDTNLKGDDLEGLKVKI